MVGKAAAARRGSNQGGLTILNAESKINNTSIRGSSPKSTSQINTKTLSNGGVIAGSNQFATTTSKKPVASRTLLSQQKMLPINTANVTRNKNTLQLKNTPSNMLSTGGALSNKSYGSPANRNFENTL